MSMLPEVYRLALDVTLYVGAALSLLGLFVVIVTYLAFR